MIQSRVVGMTYRPDISVFNSMKERIGNAAKSVKSLYPIDIQLTQNDMFIHLELDVIMKEKQPGNLEPALRELRSMAGNPRYILPCSDYDAVEKAFPDKRLKRKWYFPIGKYVVDTK